MNLTNEQVAIVSSNEDCVINAVAGSGKTTTIIEYAASRPPQTKILYLAFNKSVKLEADRKFKSKGLRNVKVDTAHSLAFRHIVPGSRYAIKANGYTTQEIVAMLGLRAGSVKHGEHIIANHINKFITYFCNSDKAKVQELNYLDCVTELTAKNFVRSFYNEIEMGARVLLSRMDKAEIEIIHDFYLKKFQLSNPQLPFDYILFDEGQDASPAMLDIVLKQNCTKVLVGDAHQQIYGWRYAVNALARPPFPGLTLSNSFRFPQTIADLAMAVLSLKSQLGEFKDVLITGKGTSRKSLSRATIARTNLGLLLNAINYVTDNRKVKHIYFEGNIHSYTYADDGASLYDVLNLYNEEPERIRDPFIRTMKSMDELEEYVEATEDVQLSMMMEIVKEYGDEIPGVIKKLKDLHTGDAERDKAEMIFSTVHRAKGMEYDVVHLVGDFLSENQLERKIKEAKEEKLPLDTAKLNEEINLLYVAVTRAKHTVYIPEAILPKEFPLSTNVQVVRAKKEETSTSSKGAPTNRSIHAVTRSSSTLPTGRLAKEKIYPAEKRSHKEAYSPWTPEMDEQLRKMYNNSMSVTRISEKLGRTKGAILARLKRMNYFEE